MSSYRDSFIDKCARGEALLEEVDEYLERWHRSSSAETIAEFLGMNDDEYSYWVRDPDVLPYIVTARARKMTLNEAVNDNYGDEIRVAARTSDSSVLARLKRWIAQHDK